MRFIKKIIILSLLFAVVLSANASGVKVNPSKLEIAVKINESVSREITVTNPTSDVQIFKVYPDDFSDIIKVDPSSFTLEAGTEKTVTITVEIKGDTNNSGTLNTDISVVAKPLAETGFQTNAGVKIPLSIAVSENSSSGRTYGLIVFLPFFILLAGITTFIYFLRWKT